MTPDYEVKVTTATEPDSEETTESNELFEIDSSEEVKDDDDEDATVGNSPKDLMGMNGDFILKQKIWLFLGFSDSDEEVETTTIFAGSGGIKGDKDYYDNYDDSEPEGSGFWV